MVLDGSRPFIKRTYQFIYNSNCSFDELFYNSFLPPAYVLRLDLLLTRYMVQNIQSIISYPHFNFLDN